MDEIVLDVFAADGAAILLADEAKSELRARAALGFGDDLAGLSVPLGEGVAGLALSTRSPVISHDSADLATRENLYARSSVWAVASIELRVRSAWSSNPRSASYAAWAPASSESSRASPVICASARSSSPAPCP